MKKKLTDVQIEIIQLLLDKLTGYSPDNVTVDWVNVKGKQKKEVLFKHPDSARVYLLKEIMNSKSYYTDTFRKDVENVFYEYDSEQEILQETVLEYRAVYGHSPILDLSGNNRK